jgi:superfamily I DNA/RNA helicase
LKTATALEVDPLDGYRLLARDEDSRLGWRIIVACDPFDRVDEALVAVLASEEELSGALPAGYREHHRQIARLVRVLIDEEDLDADETERLTGALDPPLDELREALALASQVEEEDEPEEEARQEEPSDHPSIICTSLVRAKGLSAGYVFIVGFNNGHLPRDPHAITDEEVCCFLVGLSRTRKECHLISCGRLGNEPLAPSEFACWIAPHTRDIKVDAAYFRPQRAR